MVGREFGCCSLLRIPKAGEDGRDGLCGSSTLNLTIHQFIPTTLS